MMWMSSIFTVLFAVYSLILAFEEPNEDIITVLKHVIRELGQLKTHVQQLDGKENATEKVIKLLRT